MRNRSSVLGDVRLPPRRVYQRPLRSEAVAGADSPSISNPGFGADTCADDGGADNSTPDDAFADHTCAE